GMIDRRQKTAFIPLPGNHNTGQLGNGFNHQDLRKAVGSGQTGTGNSPGARLQLDNPVEKQKGVPVGEIMCRIGIKQESLR
ncbi:MAG: hypothetical protein WCD00_03585, partial [Desulfuromonadaceae bacterium]